MGKDLSAALERALAWLDVEGVVGVGEGKEGDMECIVVLTSIPENEIRKDIPDTFKGYKVLIEYTGEIDVQ